MNLKKQQESKGYLGNPSLKKAGEIIDYSQEEIDEYAKCMVDPIYFIMNYIKIVTLDDGEQPFNLFEYQKKFINSLHDNRMTIGLFPRQHGKCYLSDTKYNIRNKKTGEVLTVDAGEFHQMNLDKNQANDRKNL